MINKELLEKAGIDYQSGVERFLNDEELYQVVLEAFVKDDVLERAQEAYACGDDNRLLKTVHEAKGSSGNAGLNKVFAEASALVTLLREDSYTQGELKEKFRRFENAYILARKGIEEALGEE